MHKGSVWADSAEVVAVKEEAIWWNVLRQIKLHIMNMKYQKKIQMQWTWKKPSRSTIKQINCRLTICRS